MSVLNMFKMPQSGQNSQTSQNPQPPQNPKKPEEPGFQQSSNEDPKNVDPATDPKAPASTSPLEEFANLFDTEPEDPKNPKPQEPEEFFSYDPEKLTQSVSKLSFRDTENFEELGQKALQGDVQALGELMDNFGRQIYAKSAQLNIGIANKAAKSSYERAAKDLPSSVRTQLSNENLHNLNPVFKNKAFEPMVQAAKNQFEQKYPNSSPQEIAQMTNKYLNAVADEMKSSEKDPTKRSSQNNPQQSNSTTDFQSFFGE